MKIDLKTYFKEKERLQQLSTTSEGPVITISREYGCEANRLVGMLLQRINESIPQERKWKYINKEIMDASATQLGLKSSIIDQRILEYSSDVFSDIFNSFGQHYDLSDQLIIENVREVIITYARKGNVIIVGRGGGLITKDMKNALRIRLIAPLETRVSRIVNKKSISYTEAEMLIKHFDENRIKWMEHLSGTRFDPAIFDLTINVETLSDKETLQVILTLMKEKGMLSVSKPQTNQVVT